MNYLGLNAVLFAWLPFPALNFHTEWRIGSPGIEDALCSSFSSTGTANRILTDSNICRSHQVNFDKWHVMGFRTLLVKMRGNIPRMEYNYITVALLCVLHGNRITFQVLLLLLLLALELRVDDGPLWVRTLDAEGCEINCGVFHSPRATELRQAFEDSSLQKRRVVATTCQLSLFNN